MSFLVIIAPLIAFMIIIIIEKMLIFHLKNQKPEGRQNIRSVFSTYLN